MTTLAATVIASVFLASCGGPGAGVLFSDEAAGSGLDFQHVNGMSGELYFAEMMGAGAGLADFDNDGDLDVYLVQGGLLGPGKTRSDLLVDPGQRALTDRLYRNDSSDGHLAFVDVTDDYRLVGDGYGMGVSCADVDNDGNTDIYLSNFGSNQLWRNTGNGHFVDITTSSGTDDPRWSVSAAFVDYDRDGWLDLYVGNYVDFRFATHKPCRSSTSARDYCSPLVYQPQSDTLFRNQGNATFTNESAAAGIDRLYGGALGVSIADFDGDRWPDIYVANDGVANQLWRNRHNGSFTDTAPIAGVAVNMDGRAEASMGVDSGDFDNDGDEDLFMTHLTRESNTLYVNDGKGWFEDRSVQMGLAGSSLGYTGFGTGWIDYDNDGDLDLLTVNGAVTQVQAQVDAGEIFPLRQRNQLFENTGSGAFVDISDRAGPVFAEAAVGRGAAFGDIDNDGDTDVVINNNNGKPRLLINHHGADNDWLGLQLVSADSGRDALGAHVTLIQNDRTVASRRVGTDGSYASCNDARIVFGLGRAAGRYAVEVSWPDGQIEYWPDVAIRRYQTLVQGTAEL